MTKKGSLTCGVILAVALPVAAAGCEALCSSASAVGRALSLVSLCGPILHITACMLHDRTAPSIAKQHLVLTLAPPASSQRRVAELALFGRRAVATIAADSMKHPTATSRAIVAGALGAAVAGTATSGLSDARMPSLSLLSMCLGAALSIAGAFSLAQVTSERTSEPKSAKDAKKKEDPATTAPASAKAAPAAAVIAPAAATTTHVAGATNAAEGAAEQAAAKTATNVAHDVVAS